MPSRKSKRIKMGWN